MRRELADLPFANWLIPADALQVEGEYDCAHFEGVVWAEADARNASFNECAFRSVTLDNGLAQSARFNAVWMHGVRFIATDLSDVTWMDVEVIQGAFAGVEASGAELRRVAFHNCKFDSLNLRGATLTKVEFSECVLRHVDFGDAKLNEVSFPGSEIEGLVVRHAELKKVDFRQARNIGISDGVEALKGAMVTPNQLMDLAPAFAAAVGLIVKD